LPTRGQIETACEGSWERALELAGLQPPSAADAGPPVALIDALLRFYEAEGYLPGYVELAEAARRQGMSLERPEGRRWPDLVEEAQREAIRRGLPQPPPYGTRPARGGKDARSRRCEGPATKGIYTRVQVLERVREFDAGLPAATSATDKQWRDFQRGRAGVPSLNVLRRHGGLRELLREASRPEWRERAEEEDRRAIRRPVWLGGRPRSDKIDHIEALIRERGEASARELAEALDYSIHVVRYFLRQLKEAGRIKPTQAYAQAKNQRYRAASTGDGGR
jgi:predicted transcriptional regulator